MYKKIIKNIFSVGSIVLFAKLFGFLKQMVLANQFGATQETDIVFFANGIIDDLNYLMTQSLLTAFVPIYIRCNSKDDKYKEVFVSNVIKVFLIIAGTIGLLSILGAPAICRVIAPAYSGEVAQQLVKDIRLFTPILFCGVLIAIFNALLRANEKFVQGELVGFYQSIVTIFFSYLLGQKYGINIMIVSAYVYSAWNVFFLAFSGRKFWRIHSGNPFNDKDVNQLLHMILPMIFGYAMVYINQQIDKILASGIEVGALTSLGYGAVLIGFITTFISSVCTIVFTYITELIAHGENKAIAEMYSKVSIIMITVFLPISIIIIANATDIVNIVFGRGAFDRNAIQSTSYALIGYGISVVPFIFRELFCRLQYGYCDTKHPMVNNTIGIMVNIILSILLCQYYGILGITMASSFSVILSAGLNYFTSKKHNVFLKVSDLMRYVPLWGIGAAGITICSIKGKSLLQNSNSFIRIFLIVLFSALVYILCVSPVIYHFIKKNESVNGKWQEKE